MPDSEHRIILTRDSLIANHPKKATDSHRNGKEYFVSNKEANEIIEKVHSNDNSVYNLKDLNAIPTNRFKDDKRTVWLFGDVAEKYGNFLKESGIDEMSLWFDSQDSVDNQGKSYANQLWLHRVGDDSVLNGDGDLDYYSGARGVLVSDEVSEKDLKVDKPKIETYTPNQISKVLKSLKLSGLEEQVLSALKKE